MKTKIILIALATLASLSMVSCKNNNKKTQSQEPSQEEVQEMKQALADTVLAQIDAFTDDYIKASENGFRLPKLELTDVEKMLKPDYLLDLSLVNTFVTKSQKVNALAMYLVDYAIRQIYDMPLDEAKEVIAKLAIELNHPISFDDHTSLPRAERIKREYEKFKENGDLDYFWQFQNAILCETNYILAKNPELFFSKISEKDLMAYNQRWASLKAAIRKLAGYDEQMKELMNTIFYNPTNEITDEELKDRYFKDVKTATETYKFDKLNQIEKRNALLQ